MQKKMVILFLLIVVLMTSLVAAAGEPIYKLNYKEIPANPVVKEGFVDVRVRYLITEKQGAENFAMRLFEFAPGGHTSYHAHPWEHEIFVKKGPGILVSKDKRIIVGQGDVIFVPNGAEHQFINESDQALELICLIPIKSP